METTEPSRDEAWYEARRIACASIAQILAKANVARRGKPSILELNLAEAAQMLEELNLAEAAQMLEESKVAIAQQPTNKPPPVEKKEESPEINW